MGNSLQHKGKRISIRAKAHDLNSIVQVNRIVCRIRLGQGFYHGVVEIDIGFGSAGEDRIGVIFETQEGTGVDEFAEENVVLIEASQYHVSMGLLNLFEGGALI